MEFTKSVDKNGELERMLTEVQQNNNVASETQSLELTPEVMKDAQIQMSSKLRTFALVLSTELTVMHNATTRIQEATMALMNHLLGLTSAGSEICNGWINLFIRIIKAVKYLHFFTTKKR